MTALPPLQPGTPEQNALWDHVYEYGNAAEGVHGLLEKVCQAYARAAIEAQGVPDVDSLTDAIAEGLRGTYHCTRVWEAWHVGTMDQDDFEPVDESDTPRELAETVIAMLAAPQPQPVQQEPVMYQFRWTNPAGQQVNDTAIEWTQVEPRWNGTVQEKCAELLAHRYGEKPCYEVRALYTSPQAAQPQPLSDGQINQMWSDAHNDTSPMSLIHVLARAIEAAHGIKGETK